MDKFNKLLNDLKKFWLLAKKFLKEPKVKKFAMFMAYTATVALVAIAIDRTVVSYNENKELLKTRMENEIAMENIVEIKSKEIVSVNDKYSFSLFGCVYNKKITPSSENYISYYDNTTDGNIYLDVIIDFTNHTDHEVLMSDILSAGIDHGSNSYSSINVVEINDYTSFEYGAQYHIQPKEKIRVHFISDVPAKIEKDPDHPMVTINVDKNLYKADALEAGF